jgi:hypothetical protein
MRRMTCAFGLGLAMGTAAVAAPAPQPWVPVGEHVDGGVVEVGRAHITTIDGITRGWWRIALAAPRTDGTAREMNLDAVDCARRLTTELEQLRYDAGGRLLAHTREDEGAALGRLSPATPGTTGEIADRAICRLRPRPPGR